MKRTDSFIEYSGETLDELLSYPAAGQCGPLVRAFEKAIQEKKLHKRSGLTTEEQVVLAIRALDREVNNGGYRQFFCNSSREYAPIVVDSLRRIGSLEAAGITQTALDVLSLASLSPGEIKKVMAKDDPKRDEELDRCDQLFYRKPLHLSERLYDFVKANRKHVRF